MRSLAVASLLLLACGAPGSDPGAMATSTPGQPTFPVGEATPAQTGASSAVTPASDPCANATLGDGSYCGSTIGGDGNALYDCAGGKTATKTVCAKGCQVNPAGVADACADGNQYHLPWKCGVSYETTQGNNGDICGSNGGDHTGIQQYAWDFGIPRHTPILASRGGTVTLAANVTGPGQNCYDGCTEPFGTPAFTDCCNACINTSNHVNVQHADGTVATYWHFDQVTVKVGDKVDGGDLLGYSGTSGCSSGPHLHFMVMGNCPTGYCQSVSIKFEEVGIPACGVTVDSANAC